MKSTFPFISAHLADSLRRPPRRARGRRGFTLVEMMVVVVIIAISAAIAVPGISKRMKSNRTKITAEQIALMYRQARIRALGRGSAVLVRFQNGRISVREGIQGTSATAVGCSQLPESSCELPATRWATNARSQEIDAFNYSGGGDFTVSLTEAAGTTQNFYEVCFAPSGRTFSRLNAGLLLDSMPGPLRIDVNRVDEVGFQRSVIVSPSGGARVVAAP